MAVTVMIQRIVDTNFVLKEIRKNSKIDKCTPPHPGLAAIHCPNGKALWIR